MLVTVAYNVHGPSKHKLALALADRLEREFAEHKMIARIRSVPLAGNHDKVWVEVHVNFIGSNAEEAKSLANALTSSGIDARTVHDND